MEEPDKQRVASQVVNFLRREARRGGNRPRVGIVDEFERREAVEDLIRLHTGALLSSGERILSVAHTLEKVNQSYWVLVEVHVQQAQHKTLQVAKIVRFLMCRLPAPRVQGEYRWGTGEDGGALLPPPYRAALAVVYETSIV